MLQHNALKTVMWKCFLYTAALYPKHNCFVWGFPGFTCISFW